MNKDVFSAELANKITSIWLSMDIKELRETIYDFLKENPISDEQVQEKIDQLTKDKEVIGDQYNHVFKDREGLRRRIEELEEESKSELENASTVTFTGEISQDSKILDLIQKAMEMR